MAQAKKLTTKDKRTPETVKPVSFTALESSQTVWFVPMTTKYGRAEFDFCPIWKRGKLQEVFVFSRQQESNEHFVIRSGYSDQFQVTSWTHKGLGNPHTWLHFWCKEHKGMGMSVYPPDGATCFSVHVGSTTSIHFSNESQP